MNSQVTATGMKVKAQAEGGIVISNEAKSNWKASADASHVISGTTIIATELIPTSTANGAQWYHAVSDDADNAKKNQESSKYTSISTANNNLSVDDGVAYWTPAIKASGTYDDSITYYSDIATTTDVDTSAFTPGTTDVSMYYILDSTNKKAIYLVNSFYIQSSADAITLGADGLYINSVTASTTTSNTTNLNKSLRVIVYLNDGTNTFSKIFAPISGADATYNVKNATSVTPVASGVKNTSTGLVNIPAYASDGTGAITASIYVFFEGEDSNCKSANLASVIDTLDIEVVFGTTPIA